MATGAGSTRSRKAPISTGLCDSGKFSTLFRVDSLAQFFAVSGRLLAQPFAVSGRPYK